METTKKTGRILGVLFLCMFIPGSIGLNLRGLSTALVESPTLIQDVFDQTFNMKIAVLLNMFAGLLGIAIAITAFPVLKKYIKPIAFWYLTLWILNYAVSAIGDVSHLSLLSLSKAYAADPEADLELFNVLGALKVEGYFWGHLLGLLLFAIGTAIFYYGLFRTRLVPRFLAVWGMLAMAIVFVATILNIFDKTVPFYLYLQNGVHLMVLAVWLIVKGFNPNAVAISSSTELKE